MLQGFEWYGEGNGTHWKRLETLVPKLAAMGLTALWLPPPYKPKGQVIPLLVYLANTETSLELGRIRRVRSLGPGEKP